MRGHLRDVSMLASVLLKYPDETLFDSLDEAETIAGGLPHDFRADLLQFISYLKSNDVQKLQETYVTTFDFNERNSLYLTYSKLGTRPERGTELLRLKNVYSENGLQMDAVELPDYLPVVLEFLSVASDEVATRLLEENATAISNLAENLVKEGSPYSLVLKSCLRALWGRGSGRVGWNGIH